MMGGSGQSGNPNAAGGQLGQMANPQTKDPMQNLNRQGAPNFKGPAQQPAQQPWSFNRNYDPSKPTGVGNWRRLPNQPAQQPDRLRDPEAHLKPMQKPGSQYGGYANADAQAFQEYAQANYPMSRDMDNNSEYYARQREAQANDPEFQRLMAAANANRENVLGRGMPTPSMGGLGGPGGPRTSQFPTGPSSAEQMAQNIPAFLQNMRGTPFGNSQMGQLLGQFANPNTSIQPAGRAGGK